MPTGIRMETSRFERFVAAVSGGRLRPGPAVVSDADAIVAMRWIRLAASGLILLTHLVMLVATGERAWAVPVAIATIYTLVVVPLTSRPGARLTAVLTLDWVVLLSGSLFVGASRELIYWFPVIAGIGMAFLPGRRLVRLVAGMVASLVVVGLAETTGLITLAQPAGSEWYAVSGPLTTGLVTILVVLSLGAGVSRHERAGRRAEREMSAARETAERRAHEMRLLFDESPVGIAFQTLSGGIVYANDEFCRLVEMDAGDVRHRGILERMAPTDRVSFDVGIAESMASGQTTRTDVAFLSGAGGSRKVSLTIRRASLGEFDGVVVIAVDRTASIQAARRSARFEAALQNTTDLVVMFDDGGRILYVNRAFCDVFGRGQPVVGALLEDVAGEEFWRHLSVDRPSVAGADELDVTTTEGRRVALSVLVTRSTGDDQLPHFTAVARDVTELVRAGEEMADLVRSKDRFIASVSHELRTPLTAVVGLASEVAGSFSDFSTEDLADFVAVIAQQSNEVAVLVEDLLTMARADAGLLSISLRPLELVDEVERALSTVPADVASGLELAGVCPTVLADPMRVRQIVRALLTNAKKFGGPRRRLEVSVLGGMARLSVADDGPPLSQSQRQAIFAAYRRGHDTVGTPETLGLGLTISRRLARMMGGDVTYDHTNGWSTFTLHVPVVAEGDHAGQPAFAVPGEIDLR